MNRKTIIAGNEISELYTFSLGGYEQKVLIEGKKRDLPVVISLHGGPGTPIPFSAGCRGLFPAFTDKFIMVYWDQLGCGINNHVIEERFTIDSFVDMSADLIREVKLLFQENPLYLFATSWGSILSVKVLKKTEGRVDGVVAWGQMIKKIFFNEEVFAALENSKLPRKKLEQIKNVDIDTAAAKELQLVSSSIRKYTSGYQNKKGKPAPMGAVIFGLMTSPDYTIKDFKAVVINGYMKNVSLFKEILKLDLSAELSAVKLPYLMLQGDTDIVTSTKEARKLAETAGNPDLRCLEVENSGHMPGAEGMEKVLEELWKLSTKK